MTSLASRLLSLSLASFALTLTACAAPTEPTEPDAAAPPATAEMAPPTEAAMGLSGDLSVDGSSTVYPITEAVAEAFMAANPDARVTVAVSGTGGGFEKFCHGEIQVADASRPIKDEELETCRAAGIDPVGLEVAFDGLAVVVNPENDFVECLTVDQLKTIWEPAAEDAVMQWNDVDPTWPAEDMQLYGPGTDSGTFDYFTEEIVGETDASRADYTASEDDNVLVQGVNGDPFSLGYFGLAYFQENADKLKLVGVDSGAGCVQPSAETVNDGTYTPLSRPLLIYVDRAAIGADPLVTEFARFYLAAAPSAAAEVGYVPLPAADYEAGMEALK